MSQFQQPQNISAVPNQVPGQVQSAGQMGIQQAQQRQQAFIANQRAQQEKANRELAREQGFQERAVQMSQVASKAQSEAEYRDLLRDKAQMEADLTRESQQSQQQRWQADHDLEKRQFSLIESEMIFDLEQKIADARSRAGTSAEQKAMLAERQAKMAENQIKMAKAKAIQEGHSDQLGGMFESALTELDRTLNNAESAKVSFATMASEEMSHRNWIGNRDTTEVYGYDPYGSGSEWWHGVLEVLEPHRLGRDDADVDQTMRLLALGEETFDTGEAVDYLSPRTLGTVGMGLPTQRSTMKKMQIDTQNVVNTKIASVVSKGLKGKGLTEAQRGAIHDAVLGELNFLKGQSDVEAVMTSKQRLVEVAKENGVDPLSLQIGIHTATQALEDRRVDLLASGVSDNYNDLDNINEVVEGMNMKQFDVWEERQFINQNNLESAKILTSGLDDLSGLNQLREALGAEVGVNFSAQQMERLLGRFEREYGEGTLDSMLSSLEGTDEETGLDEILEGLSEYSGSEGDIKDLVAAAPEEEAAFSQRYNQAQLQRDQERALAELEALEEQRGRVRGITGQQ